MVLCSEADPSTPVKAVDGCSPHQPQSRLWMIVAPLDKMTSYLKPLEELGAGTTQLSHSQIPDPRKMWDINVYYFKHEV